jgi:general secretion pathway protein L
VVVERGGDYECYRASRRGPSLFAKGSLDSLTGARLPRAMLSQPVEVRLDGARILSKVVRLPAASRNYLDAVVRHQLDRATPWAADRVVFDYAIAEEEPTADDQIAVRLVATSRDVFDAALERLRSAGIRPAVVGTSEDPVERASPVNLMQADRPARRAKLRRRVAAALLALILVGAAVSAWTGWRFFSLDAEAARLAAEMGAVRAEIEAARAGMEASESRGRLMAQKRETLPAVVLLDRLSDAIPTSTYLTEFMLEGQELRLSGLSSEAPSLIGILEGSDFLSNVRFAAPTTREAGATQERFEIVANVVAQVPAD